MRSQCLLIAALALFLGHEARAQEHRRMDDAERARFRTELLRLDLGNVRRASARNEAQGRSGSPRRGGLSPQERQALREQLRQNAAPWDAAPGFERR